MKTETITWYPINTNMPDADITVLIFNEAWPSDPVGQGCFDGKRWRDVENGRLDDTAGVAAPTHWADMPIGPCDKVTS